MLRGEIRRSTVNAWHVAAMMGAPVPDLQALLDGSSGAGSVQDDDSLLAAAAGLAAAFSHLPP